MNIPKGLPEIIFPPPEIKSIREGSVLCWAPLKPDSKCLVRVLYLRWDEIKWWVQTEALEDAGDVRAGDVHWNLASRFIEACVLIEAAEE